jgi:NADPH-dependent curcumin reductase CurA
MQSTRAVTLAKVPSGVPQPADFAVQSLPLPEVTAGKVLCRAQFLSLDPYLRSVLSGRHLGHSLDVGAVIPGSAVSVVERSAHDDFAVGDLVSGALGWQTLALVDGASLRKLPSAIFPSLAPASTALGVLGMPGLTAWAGITQLAKVTAGDTVLISAALGPVGSSAGQIAKALGARVIGIAGGAQKCAQVVSHFGFDACVDYKSADFLSALKAACPLGVNVYFDNVGGRVLEAALAHLALHARVVLCGLIDQYNADVRPAGPNLGPVIGARATMMGLVVYDFYPMQAAFLAYMQTLLQQHALRWLEDVSHGLESTPAAFCKLMSGGNFGKSLVQL